MEFSEREFKIMRRRREYIASFIVGFLFYLLGFALLLYYLKYQSDMIYYTVIILVLIGGLVTVIAAGFWAYYENLIFKDYRNQYNALKTQRAQTHPPDFQPGQEYQQYPLQESPQPPQQPSSPPPG